MANMSIRDLPDPTYAALKDLAVTRSAHGKRSSIEAVAREILIEATQTQQDLGSKLAAIGRRFGGIELDIPPRLDPIEPAEFE